MFELEVRAIRNDCLDAQSFPLDGDVPSDVDAYGVYMRKDGGQQYWVEDFPFENFPGDDEALYMANALAERLDTLLNAQ